MKQAEMKMAQILEKLYDAEAMYQTLLEDEEFVAVVEDRVGYQPSFSSLVGDLQDIEIGCGIVARQS